jgi:hypothetical protein
MLLKVTTLDTNDITYFSDPDSLARASEGFCPFKHHWDNRDTIYQVEPQSDGSVICRAGLDDSYGLTLRYEWIDSVDGYHHAHQIDSDV